MDFGMLLVLLVLYKVNTCSSQRPGPEYCTPHWKDPDGCLSTEDCTYCSKTDYTENRCNSLGNLVRKGCPRQYTLNHIASELNVTFTNQTQQPIPLPLLPNTTRTVTINFILADHPVDVYYLMDFSGSMADDQANVVSLSKQLVSAVQKMSTDTTLGFGSFVDKPIYPLGGYNDYSYRNDLPLRKNMDGFAAAVAALPILSGNDAAESQADAMFQAVSCSAQIGWRSHARHLLVLATDDIYHVAGDGLRAGITSAFDGKCHLNAEGLYTEETKLDYPSDEQLISAFQSQQVTPIFAVTGDAESVYRKLAGKLKASGVAPLSSDSSNVVELLLAEYEKIDSRFELETSKVSNEIAVRFYSNCDASLADDTEIKICKKLSKSRTVTFKMEVELKDCPSDPAQWNQKLKVNPAGLPSHVDFGLALICT